MLLSAGENSSDEAVTQSAMFLKENYDNFGFYLCTFGHWFYWLTLYTLRSLTGHETRAVR